MKKTKKEKRGGYRENAGRPKSNVETKTLSFRVPAIHAPKLKELLSKVIADYLK